MAYPRSPNIPKNAKKVFEGELFNVYQWRQKMFDGSYARFEMLDRVPTVDIIATVGDTIIVLTQKQPRRSWYSSLPGGRIDPAERANNAARRELLEETGYEPQKFLLFGAWFGHSKLYWPQYLYTARGCKSVAKQKLDAGEKIKIRLVSFNAFLQLARDEEFGTALPLKFQMYEALLDPKKKEKLRRKIFGN